MSNFKKALALLVVVGFIGLGAHNLLQNKNTEDRLKKELNQTQIEHQQTQQQLMQVEGDKAKTQEQKQKLEQENQQQLDKIKELEQQLSVKRENAKRLAEATTLVPTVSAAPVSKSCEEYLAAAGITDPNARELMRRENTSCDPQRYNMAGSGACGIAQELPCGKSGCGIPPNANGACQVEWMADYVVQRYGSWAGAIAFHDANNWY